MATLFQLMRANLKLQRVSNDFSSGAGPSVATLGHFDGMHRGHQELLLKLREQANIQQLPMAILLFSSNDQTCAQPVAQLSRLRDKVHHLKEYGVDYVYLINIQKILAKLPINQFLQNYFFSLLQPRYSLVGQDFTFGHQQEGNLSLLQKKAKENGCKIDILPLLTNDKKMITTKQIRQNLANGQLSQAANLLGNPYNLFGRVIKGDGRGRQWGIPTANLNVHRYLLPLKGVFCVQALRKNAKPLYGVANLGNRPTVDGTKNILEIHFFDFEGCLYGEQLQVYFLHKLRDEIKFNSIDTLIAQIREDIRVAHAFFQNKF